MRYHSIKRNNITWCGICRSLQREIASPRPSGDLATGHRPCNDRRAAGVVTVQSQRWRAVSDSNAPCRCPVAMLVVWRLPFTARQPCTSSTLHTAIVKTLADFSLEGFSQHEVFKADLAHGRVRGRQGAACSALVLMGTSESTMRQTGALQGLGCVVIGARATWQSALHRVSPESAAPFAAWRTPRHCPHRHAQPARHQSRRVRPARSHPRASR